MSRSEAIQLELFTNRFRQVVSEMGELLERTAVSVNVKERRDFSCALLDREGRLVVNAPHIPVHLGALGMCVRALTARFDWRPGDVAVTNHPAFGGSHLPDVTVVSPVFVSPGVGGDNGTSRLLGFVANRAHHAEIGGSRPGSMPPDAASLAEEGVVIEPMLLARAGDTNGVPNEAEASAQAGNQATDQMGARDGVFAWDQVRALLTSGPYPSRAVSENLADLAAAVAANRRGAELLVELAHTSGADTVERMMTALARQAASGLAKALGRFAGRRYRAQGRLDDGSEIRVAIDVPAGAGEPVRIDFSGTAGVHPGNLNAVPGIVRSAVLYVLRLLVDEPLPLNEGLLENVELVIPEGLLNPPFPSDPALAPAVVGGNVETSQRVVETLLAALGVVAGSQGTMNNVLFGNERFAYYETVGGGAGAGPGFDGASAVHTHMTNTAITDPEILEQRYPVRLHRLGVRQGSGGAGTHNGGDGIVREIEFLEPLSLSVVTQSRAQRPAGLDGGEPGRAGRQRVLRASGEIVSLAPIDGCEVEAGDRLVLETPGGGGYGPVESGAEAVRTDEIDPEPT